MGLYEKIVAERAEEERRRGRPLGMFHQVDTPALDRLLADTPKDRPGYHADLALLRRYVRTGPTNAGTGMRYRALRQKYQREYAEFKAEARGQDGLLYLGRDVNLGQAKQDLDKSLLTISEALGR